MSRPQTETVQKTRHPNPNPGGKKRGTDSPASGTQGAKRGLNTSSKAVAALIHPDKPLTDVQRAFVKNWAAGESIMTATIRAGLSDPSYGYRLAAQPNVLKLYNEEKLAYEKASDMSRKKVMDMLLKAYEHAEFAQEPASMVSAAREIGRMCGYYEPVKHRVEVNVTGNIVLDRMNRLTDAELLDYLTKEDPSET